MKRQMRWFDPAVALGKVNLDEVPEWAVDRRSLVEVCGDRLARRLVARARRDGKFRRDLVREMRAVVWIIRNSRQCTVPVVVDAIEKLLLLGDLWLAVGLPDDTYGRLVNCLFDGCACEGCDLYDGQRVQKWKPPRYVPVDFISCSGMHREAGVVENGSQCGRVKTPAERLRGVGSYPDTSGNGSGEQGTRGNGERAALQRRRRRVSEH
jgi:hypothetical protein